jgi:hypothetical protein
MLVIKPPSQLPPPGATRPSVFLAGSIEMGLARRWQDELSAHLDDLDVLVMNPRRDAWDASWEQSIDNPAFREQVEWELAALERATVVAMYLDPATKAPISLLELGLHARSSKMIVCCPDGFYRKGNVDVVCLRYGITQAATLDELAALLRAGLVGSPPRIPAGN